MVCKELAMAGSKSAMALRSAKSGHTFLSAATYNTSFFPRHENGYKWDYCKIKVSKDCQHLSYREVPRQNPEGGIKKYFEDQMDD
jgi:hypothetical protein